MNKFSAWIQAFRLHTLPLALSTIIMGSFLAAFHHSFKWAVLILAVFTTLFLQILSNLANDYGDALKGVDNENRLGPQRGLQQGAISLKEMKNAIIAFIILSLISGIWLIVEGTKGLEIGYGIFWLLIGIASIAAAMKYTMGKRPYGYSGFGDLFVFIFFGLVGVLGTFYLHTHSIPWTALLPAISMGCFSAGVLNLNNLRDRENDALHGKNTLVVKLGLTKAKNYHTILLSFGILTSILYFLFFKIIIWKWFFLFSFIGIIGSIVVVRKNKDPKDLYPELKKLVLSTLLFSLLFGIGLLL